MSRLIFEGNTRDRFGELFPKPFIEEIRVFDTTIETDVAVYFEVPEGLTAEEFLEETGMDQLRVYIGPIGGQMFEKAQSFDIGVDFSNPTSVIYADVDGNYAFWAASRITEYITKTLGEYGLAEETEIDVRSFRLNSSNSEFFYNSDGTKFLKFLITDDTWQYISTIAGGQYIIAVCYFENIPNDEKILITFLTNLVLL